MGKCMEESRKIPRTMSTQHPDNVSVPQWCQEEIIDGDTEVYEVYYAYSVLGCHEVMWDSEGKDVDTRVVRKLLAEYGGYFKEHVIGKDVFLTYRIPNPRIEAVERKIVVETLYNIPVAYDVASTFYKKDVTPIFEVILPFTTTSSDIICLHNYYKRAVVGSEDLNILGSLRVEDWVGSFRPRNIEVIPLVEDFGSILTIDKIVAEYAEAVKPKYLRVFIARSDPALNYGIFCAVLLSKIALSKLRSIEREYGVNIYSILGVGSMPFRGHLSPDNMERFLNEYGGISTVTIQSALRYDHPSDRVKEVVNILNSNLPNGEPAIVEPHDENILLKILNKSRLHYESVVEDLAPLVNSLASYIPQRRARKLHIGLFGYSRNVAGVILPRAIPFTAALYSIGIPPEIIGCKFLQDLKDNEWNVLQRYYINIKNDFKTVGGYVSWENMNMLMDMHQQLAERVGMSAEKLENALTKLLDDIRAIEVSLGIKLGPKNMTQRKHENFANNFLISYIEREDIEAKSYFVEAAKLRRFLG
ncbi:MAG: phosphoenolpyruvate carboxylase [Candidatus Bathyarchaeia archaeon]